MKGFNPVAPLLLTDWAADHRSAYCLVMLYRQPNLSGLSLPVCKVKTTAVSAGPCLSIRPSLHLLHPRPTAHHRSCSHC